MLRSRTAVVNSAFDMTEPADEDAPAVSGSEVHIDSNLRSLIPDVMWLLGLREIDWD